jgi:two-component system, NarL family, sensor kinase
VVGLVVPELRDIRAMSVSIVVHLVAGLLVVTVFSMLLSTLDVAGVDVGDLSVGALGLLAALCAAGYAPAARMLRVVVDRLLFGDRRDPIDAAWRAGERLSDDPVLALRSLRESLVLPYAALVDGSGRTVASSGTPQTSLHRHDLSPTDASLGRLEVGLRQGEVALPARDRAVLAVLAPALVQLMHARALSAELQVSRAAVVEAVEEERRRLRRDLHDGLGPRLTGVAYTADAARNTLGGDPARAGELLAGLRAEAGEAILEVRRLVEGLRPPSLDQVGLEQTLRQHAQHLHAADGSAMTVEFDVPVTLPALTAAVEVTAYRIVVEALTNAARHSGADRVRVDLRHDADTLCIEVYDNGPAAVQAEPGVGLTSMRERAELLGGTAEFASTPTGGRLTARLPLRVPDQSAPVRGRF